MEEASPKKRQDMECLQRAAPEAELIPKRCFKFLHENELNTFLDLLQDGKVDQSDDDEVIPKHLRLTSHQNLRRFQLKYEGPLVVQCSNPNCQRFSEIPRNGDPSIIPEHWFCSMTIARCWKNKEWTPTPREFIKVEFVPGSLVWAKVSSHPLWPGMVDFCPDTREYYWNDNDDADEPTHYNVVFFVPKVARTWVSRTHLKPFNNHELKNQSKAKNYKETLKAYEYNLELVDMTLRERLLHHSFLNLFKGKWSDFEIEQRKKLKLAHLKRKRSESATKVVWKRDENMNPEKLERLKHTGNEPGPETVSKKTEKPKFEVRRSDVRKDQIHDNSSEDEEIPLDTDSDISESVKSPQTPPVVLDEFSGHLIEPLGKKTSPDDEEPVAPITLKDPDVQDIVDKPNNTGKDEPAKVSASIKPKEPEFRDIAVQFATAKETADPPVKATAPPPLEAPIKVQLANVEKNQPTKIIVPTTSKVSETQGILVQVDHAEKNQPFKCRSLPQPFNLEDIPLSNVDSLGYNDLKKIRRKLDPRASKAKGVPMLSIRMGDFKGQSMVCQSLGTHRPIQPKPSSSGVHGPVIMNQRPLKPILTTRGESQHAYVRPPLSARFLVILAVQNSLHPTTLKTDFSCVLEFLMTHFPYFELRPELARSVLELVLGTNNDQVFAIAPESLTENELALRQEVEQNQSQLRDSMRYPCLLEAFLSHCSYPPRQYVAGPLEDDCLMMVVFWSLHSQVHGFVDHRQSKHEMDLVFRFMFPFFSLGSTNYVLPILLERFEPNRCTLKRSLLALSEMTESDIGKFSSCQKYLRSIALSFKRSLENGLLT